MSMFGRGDSKPVDDLKWLERVHHGDWEAIQWACSRYRIPVFALGLKESNSVDTAQTCVRPVIVAVCQRLIRGQISPDEWGAALRTEVEAWCAAYQQFDANHQEGEVPRERELASPFSAIPRIARRRMVGKALQKMELPDVIAVLMRLLENASANEIMDLVDDDLPHLIQCMVDAERQLREAASTDSVDAAEDTDQQSSRA